MKSNSTNNEATKHVIASWREALQAWHQAGPGIVYSKPNRWQLPNGDAARHRAGWVRHTTWTNPAFYPPRPEDVVREDGFVARYLWRHERLESASRVLAQATIELAGHAERLHIDSTLLRKFARALRAERGPWWPCIDAGHLPEGLEPAEVERHQEARCAIDPRYFDLRDSLIPDCILLIDRVEARTDSSGMTPPTRDLNDVEARILAKLRSANGKAVSVADIDASAKLKRASRRDAKRRQRALEELKQRGEVMNVRRGWWRATLGSDT